MKKLLTVVALLSFMSCSDMKKGTEAETAETTTTDTTTVTTTDTTTVAADTTKDVSITSDTLTLGAGN
ncbi:MULTISPECIES: entericidin [Nibribacter]|uniref:Entericidin n=2 Tax=Nibribacter TaxID=1649474 RepID=A0A6P1NX31_9BACT|nr:entericidin [Nibribacter ruber]QHL88237.1 entericidin [Nibribacter ruber]